MSCKNYNENSSSTQVGLHIPTDSVIHIDYVVRKGLNCDCVCLDCGYELKAVIEFKKADTAPYFQHHNPNNDNPCSFSGISRETELHFNLKHQVAKEKQIAVPPYYISRDCPYPAYKYKSFRAYSGGILNFDDVLVEKRAGDIIPDCIGVVGDYRIAIEIKVTHGVGDDKLEMFKSLGMDCVELYAPKQYMSFPATEVINNPKNTKWLYFGKSLKEETLLQADKWFEHQKYLIEQKIAQKKIRLQEADRAIRPRRVEKLVTLFIEQWIDENLYYRSVKEEDLPSSLQEFVTSHGGDLAEYPIQLIESVNFLEQQVSDLDQAIKASKFTYKEKRRELIIALSDRSSALNVQSVGCAQDLLYSIDSSEIFRLGLTAEEAKQSEEEVLNQFIDDIDRQFSEQLSGSIFKEWREKQEARGIGLANTLKVFQSSPQYHSIEVAIEKGLADRRGVPSRAKISGLMNEYFKLKAYASIPLETHQKGYQEVFNRLAFEKMSFL